MNAYFLFDDFELWQLTGWTMLHFLWLGTVAGVIAGAFRLLLRQASPNARYAAAAASLALLASLPLAIAACLSATSTTNVLVQDAPAEARGVAVTNPAQTSPPGDPTADEIIELSGRDETVQFAAAPSAPGSAGELPGDAVSTTTQVAAPPAVPETPRQSRGLTGAADGDTNWRGFPTDLLQTCALYLPWLWLIGTPLTFALLATGIIGTHRLRLASRPIHDGPIAELLAQLATSLKVGKRVGLAVCDRIAAPVLVGIVRPIILLPPAALTGWSPDEIEMVMLHELAHVRRWDNLVNLAQRIIESLLFFHPVVWLVSNWVRREREVCCDAVVVGRTNRPHAYAELLVALAAQMPRSVLFHPAASSAMAAGPLRARIRRILQLEDDPMLVSGKSLLIALASLLVAATLAVLYLPAIGQAEESTTENAGEASKSEPATLPADKLIADELTLQTPDGEVLIQADGDRAQLSGPASQPVPVESDPQDKSDDSGKAPKLAEEQEVLITIPGTAHPYVNMPAELLGALNDAYTHKLNVDLVKRDSDWALIVVPRPTETDWPAILGEPPLKNRVIADKAWRRLGLKLIPATELESWIFAQYGFGGQVKIIGGNVPKGLPLPAFVRRIGNEVIDSFDKLHVWLSDSGLRSPDPVKVFAVADGNEYLLEAHAIGEAPPAQGPNPPTTHSDPKSVASGPLRSHKFLSLEDQKLADLAYKRLGLELEAIGDEDLKRVRALGYDGGLRVAAGAAGVGGNVIQYGDILVGLHVWPTATMQALAEVLERDDLAELNPLKFYVVYQRTFGDPNQPTVVDAVRTGRVSLISQGGGFGGGRSTNRNAAPTTLPRDRDIAAPQPESPPQPRTGQGAPSPLQPAASDRAVVAYEIPDELRDDIRQYRDTTNLRGIWDEQSRFILQASPEQHERLKSLLEATPKWRAASAEPKNEIRRNGGVIVRTKKDGQEEVEVLEWPATGLTFARETRPEYPGVVVVEVAPGSPAAWQDIRPGDIMGGMDGFYTRSLVELESVIKTLLSGFPSKGKQVEVPFRRVSGRSVQSLPKKLPLRLDSTGAGSSPARPAGATERRRAPALQADRYATAPQTSAQPSQTGIDPVAGPVQVESIPNERSTTLAVRGSAKTDSDVPRYVLPSSAEEDSRPQWPKQEIPGITPKPAPTAPPKSADAPARPADPRSNLRYDGKTFDEWRAAWQTDLSTEKRVEAVKALGAFGRAGYPNEAAEAILDVAGEYDFSVIQNDAEGKLKEAILAELAPEYGRPSMAEDWLPELVTRLEKEPKKWQSFTGNLLWRLRTEDERVITILRSLAKTGPEEIQDDALSALATCLRNKSSGLIDDETRGLITAALQSNNRQTAISALAALLYSPMGFGTAQDTHLQFQPEIIPLLFHTDPEIQQYAQHVLRYIRSEDAPQVVEKLTAILQDETKQGDHIAAIRSLSGIGQHAAVTVPQLEQILKDGDSIEARVAAGHAIDAIESGGRGRNELLRQSNAAQDEKEQAQYTRLINAEEQVQQVQHRKQFSPKR